MKKFCCDKFQYHYSVDKTMGLNIRIIKLSESFVERGQLDFDRNTMITEGYTGSIMECKKVFVINYCPFCGVDLKKFYISDEYIQEIIDY